MNCGREQRDDLIEVEFGGVDDLLRCMTFEHGSRHERTRVQNHRTTAHEALPFHRDQFRVAGTRADKKHRHSLLHDSFGRHVMHDMRHLT